MKLYSTDVCPKCSMLKKKLDELNIEYEVENDEDLMIEKGIMSVPMLEVDSGELLSFTDAIEYINKNYY